MTFCHFIRLVWDTCPGEDDSISTGQASAKADATYFANRSLIPPIDPSILVASYGR